jgi:hypothetical protein
MIVRKSVRGKAFTRLYATIRQERGAYTVTVKLQNHRKRRESAWGEEIASTFEMASSMIGRLADEFSIPQNRVSISIGMENFREGTRH